MTGVLDAFAREQLAELERLGLLRVADDGRRREAAASAAEARGRAILDASSNDYLGLAALSVSRETGVQVGPAGAGASRLIHGTRPEHVRLEQALASWVELPFALLFTSGYAANVGLLSAIAVPETVVLSDALNHASTIDGCRLGKGRIEVVPHLDLSATERALRAASSARARWVVTEACFSMDGDGPDLPALRALCDEHRAGLIVDEAHSLGVFGPRGAGRCVEAGVVPDALVGTFGKAVGTQGAFIAGSSLLRDFLWNRARSFVFSTATSPLVAEQTVLHVERVQAADELRKRVRRMVAELRHRLSKLGLELGAGLGGPIMPVVLGENAVALRVAAALEAEGILAQAIRPPTVPAGSARLRLTVSAAWSDDDPERIANAMARALGRTP